MKNAALIKVGLILSVLVLVVVGIVGQLMKRNNKNIVPSSNTMSINNYYSEPIKESDITSASVTETEVKETIDYTIKADLSDEFPEEEPDREIAEVSDITIIIYFTNMQEIDESNLLPLTAWEKLSIQTQKYLNDNDIVASEIQAVSGSLKNENNTMSFETILPELSGSQLTITYDLLSKNFFFDIMIPSLETEEIEVMVDDTGVSEHEESEEEEVEEN